MLHHCGWNPWVMCVLAPVTTLKKCSVSLEVVGTVEFTGKMASSLLHSQPCSILQECHRGPRFQHRSDCCGFPTYHPCSSSVPHDCRGHWGENKPSQTMSYEASCWESTPHFLFLSLARLHILLAQRADAEMSVCLLFRSLPLRESLGCEMYVFHGYLVSKYSPESSLPHVLYLSIISCKSHNVPMR